MACLVVVVFVLAMFVLLVLVEERITAALLLLTYSTVVCTVWSLVDKPTAMQERHTPLFFHNRMAGKFCTKHYIPQW